VSEPQGRGINMLSRASSLVYGRSLCVDFSRLKVFTERRLGAWPAAGRRAQAASASAPCRGTRNTAGPAPACRRTRGGGGRRPAGRSRGSSRAPAEDVQPRRPGDQRGPYRWRPQHVPASGQAPIQRSTTSSASMRWARSAFSLAAPALISTPRVRTPNAPVLTIRQTSGPRGYCRRARKAHRTQSAGERSARRRTRA
jgi:hypothetical protein